jgi:hypothetical protein
LTELECWERIEVHRQKLKTERLRHRLEKERGTTGPHVSISCSIQTALFMR